MWLIRQLLSRGSWSEMEDDRFGMLTFDLCVAALLGRRFDKQMFWRKAVTLFYQGSHAACGNLDLHDCIYAAYRMT